MTPSPYHSQATNNGFATALAGGAGVKTGDVIWLLCGGSPDTVASAIFCAVVMTAIACFVTWRETR